MTRKIALSGTKAPAVLALLQGQSEATVAKDSSEGAIQDCQGMGINTTHGRVVTQGMTRSTTCATIWAYASPHTADTTPAAGLASRCAISVHVVEVRSTCQVLPLLRTIGAQECQATLAYGMWEILVHRARNAEGLNQQVGVGGIIDSPGATIPLLTACIPDVILASTVS